MWALFNLTDVMPPWVEPVHSRHSPLCQATDREGKCFIYLTNLCLLKR